jgi:hypothetical protein
MVVKNIIHFTIRRDGQHLAKYRSKTFVMPVVTAGCRLDRVMGRIAVGARRVAQQNDDNRYK